jgi:hypothetical protein
MKAELLELIASSEHFIEIRQSRASVYRVFSELDEVGVRESSEIRNDRILIEIENVLRITVYGAPRPLHSTSFVGRLARKLVWHDVNRRPVDSNVCFRDDANIRQSVRYRVDRLLDNRLGVDRQNSHLYVVQPPDVGAVWLPPTRQNERFDEPPERRKAVHDESGPQEE